MSDGPCEELNQEFLEATDQWVLLDRRVRSFFPASTEPLDPARDPVPISIDWEAYKKAEKARDEAFERYKKSQADYFECLHQHK